MATREEKYQKRAELRKAQEAIANKGRPDGFTDRMPSPWDVMDLADRAVTALERIADRYERK